MRVSPDPRGCAGPGLAAFFSVHYGIFTLVHGVFTFVLAGIVGVSAQRAPYVFAVAALMLSHGLSTALYWFARGERDVVSPQRAMPQPYGRVVAEWRRQPEGVELPQHWNSVTWPPRSGGGGGN